MTAKLTTLLLVTLALNACTEQQIYNATQGAREQECQKLPNATDMRHCMEMADKEYGQYIRDRY